MFQRKNFKYFSLALILLLSCYLLGTALFVRLFSTISMVGVPTPTLAPTFTPSLSTPAAVILTPTPLPTPTPAPIDTPTQPPPVPPTATPLPPTPTPTPTLTPVPAPQVVASVAVNVRSGPGTNYPVVGGLPPGVPVAVTGRNADSSWWQISTGSGTGWVANSVVQVSAAGGVPVVEAPPPPPPTATPVPPTPERPRYQYEPTGWFDDTNYGLTRFLGTITDAAGNPVDGVYVEASCGAFRVLSNASGTTGWPPGFYDITLARNPIPCDWGLVVVASEDGKTATGQLSELITVKVTVDKSIITANWRKNW